MTKDEPEAACQASFAECCQASPATPEKEGDFVPIVPVSTLFGKLGAGGIAF